MYGTGCVYKTAAKAILSPLYREQALFNDVAGDVVHAVLHHALGILEGIDGPDVNLDAVVVQLLHALSGEGLVVDVQIQLLLLEGIQQPVGVLGNKELGALLGLRQTQIVALPSGSGFAEKLKELRLTFWSDFKYPIRVTMAPNRQKQQRIGVPSELIKDYTVRLMLKNEVVKEIHIKDNYQRLNVVDLENTLCDTAEIHIHSTNGHENAVIFEVRAY